ncbi:MAG: DUF1501 domain-containing protein [Myxococcota bacterium]
MAHSRREFLLGGVSLLGAMALGLPRAARAQAASGKRMILVTCNGGWDVTFHLDPKSTGITGLDVPAGAIATAGSLTYYSAVACNGVVDAYMSAHHDVTSIIRGISVRSISHDVCIRRMLTGSPSTDAADMGVVAGAWHGSTLPAPYLTLGAVSFPGTLEGSSVRTGLSNQLALAHRHGEIDPNLGAAFPNDQEQGIINDFLRQGGTRLRNTRGQYGRNQAKALDYLDAIERTQGLYENREVLGNPFSVSLSLQDQLNSALAMLERGVCWSVNVSTGFVWDTHDPSATPSGNYQRAQGAQNMVLWPALTNLLTELKTRPGLVAGSKMIDDTVVVVLSEMTRTPLYNGQGGKDHWPHTSAMVAGGGVNVGQIFGATDNTLSSQKVNLTTGQPDEGGVVLESNHFVAGIMELVGVPSAEFLPQVPPLAALMA